MTRPMRLYPATFAVCLHCVEILRDFFYLKCLITYPSIGNAVTFLCHGNLCFENLWNCWLVRMLNHFYHHNSTGIWTAVASSKCHKLNIKWINIRLAAQFTEEFGNLFCIHNHKRVVIWNLAFHGIFLYFLGASSSSNKHKFQRNFKPVSPICTCNTGIEDNEHFLLQCSLYEQIRNDFITIFQKSQDLSLTTFNSEALCELRLF